MLDDQSRDLNSNVWTLPVAIKQEEGFIFSLLKLKEEKKQDLLSK